jgi:tetratricopeptide (TPR) repeat protein
MAYGDAKTRFPNNEVCHAGYAETLRSLGQYSEALMAYGEAKIRFPQNVVCHAGYAETLRSLGQPMQAMAEYRQLLLRFPNDQVIAKEWAGLILEQGELVNAEKFTTATKINISWHDYHVLAMLKLKQGDIANAEVMLYQGAENAILPPARTVFRQSLSTLFLRQQNYTQAEQTLRPSSAQIIEFPLDRVLRAHAMAGLNQLSEASACLAQIETESAQIIELKQFVARRFGLSTGSQAATQPDPSLEQALCDAEFNYLLRAA